MIRLLRDFVEAMRFVLRLAWFGLRAHPGILVGLVLMETIYWTSPDWAQAVHFPTRAGDRVAAVRRCAELLATTCAPRRETAIVHDGGVPIPPEALPEWTPIRVEGRYESGLTIVSSLGPHANFQYIVRDLALPVGTTFRVFHGAIIKT